MDLMLYRKRVSLVLACVIAGSTARAQCPDGSPPPCRAMTVASAARRLNPPLDERTWIVVPFDNIAHSSDAEWLRGASVNLLYLGMSRWTDVRVIDDERVADFMRDVPEAKGATSLSLTAGLAVAKRAGAGRLVMGDVLKLGNRTAVTAKVFDVKTGQRLRSVREETAVQDSMMPMFGKLAQRILNVSAPQGTNTGVVGTTSIAAFQEYAQGMQAMNVFDLARARGHFERALQLDSAFALAHAKLSVLIGWDTPGDPAGRSHAEAAARLGTSLPPRERTLVNANVSFARGEYAKSCEMFSGLVRNDSTDVDAWYGLGDCLYHDPVIESVNGDTTRLRFRTDLNASIRAFQRALDVDPTYHLAYQHIVDASTQEFRPGRFCIQNRCATYVALIRWSGDSLVATPLLMPRDTAILRREQDLAVRVDSRRTLLNRAVRTADQWVAANPTEDRAGLMRSKVLLLVGRVADADSALTNVRIPGNGGAASQLALSRLEIAIKRWRADEAIRLYDSVRASKLSVVSSPTRVITAGNIAALSGVVFGRFAGFDSLVNVGMTQAGVTGASLRLSRELPRLLVGLPSDSLAVLERPVLESIAAKTAGPLDRLITGYSLAYALRAERKSWPPVDSTTSDLKVRPAIALARRDTSALRVAARRLDSLSRTFVTMLVPDTGITMIAADAYLMLGDSAKALDMTRRMLDTIIPYAAVSTVATGNNLAPTMIPRAMLLRADLAAALGQKDEARLWYKRFLDFWQKPDPEFLPLVERVRKAYTAMGGS